MIRFVSTNLQKKIEYLTEHPEMGKPLRNRLKGKWRVHIGPYVLLYTIDSSQNCIMLLKFKHHDEVYSWFVFPYPWYIPWLIPTGRYLPVTTYYRTRTLFFNYTIVTIPLLRYSFFFPGHDDGRVRSSAKINFASHLRPICGPLFKDIIDPADLQPEKPTTIFWNPGRFLSLIDTRNFSFSQLQ